MVRTQTCIDILKKGTVPVVLLFGMFTFTLVIDMAKKITADCLHIHFRQKYASLSTIIIYQKIGLVILNTKQIHITRKISFGYLHPHFRYSKYNVFFVKFFLSHAWPVISFWTVKHMRLLTGEIYEKCDEFRAVLVSFHCELGKHHDKWFVE